MNGQSSRQDKQSRGGTVSILIKSTKIALIILGIIIAGIVLMIWLGGDLSTLPFNYDGFD